MNTRLSLMKLSLLPLLLASLAVPQAASANIALKALVNHGGQSVTIAGNTILDAPFTMNCPGAGNCTLVIEGIGTIGDDPGNAWSEWILCAYVDNTYYYGCAVQGLMRTDGVNHGWTTGNTRQVFTVPQGNHTVEFHAYSTTGGTMAQWQATYFMYK
jgi:hypothetical protein